MLELLTRISKIEFVLKNLRENFTADGILEAMEDKFVYGL